MTIRHALTAAAGNTSPATPTDPQFNYVSMLLHGDGTNGAQNNTFVSTPITAPASGYFAGLFDGTGDYLTVAAASAIDLTGTDFTIEAWVYPGTQTNSVDSVFGYGFFTTMLYRNGSTWSWEVGNGSSNFFTLTGTCTQNTWQHVALTRSGNTYTMWVNGVSASTTTNANSPATASRTLAIGVNNSASTTQCFTGYISNFRIVKGTAVYTANFTPPTAPLTAISGTSLLTCMSGFGATFSDLSSNNFTITRFGNATMTGVATTPPGAAPFSASLPGSPSYVTVGGGMPSGAGTAFTMECWIYITDLSSSNIITRGNSGGTFDWGITTSGAIALDNTTVANICSSATGVITANTWYHVAVTRSTGNVYKLWANGTNVATSSAFGTSMTANTTIGYSSFSSSHFFKGRISNFRVATSEVYTANFAPPSAPLTAISGTSLLTFQNATFLDNSPNAYSVTANGSAAITSSNVLPAITRNGNTTQGSLSPYGNLWSNYFDSNTTYLSFPSNTASNFGSSNFTFECWYYPMHTTGDANLFWWNGDPSGNNGWAGMRLQFNTWNGRTVSLLCSESASTWNVNVTTGTVYSPNTWFHVAVVRNGATVTAYLNGTSIASGNLSSSGASLYAGTENLINNMVYPAGTRTAGGRANISNVRMLKGTALYTSNFTPPTAPLTAITNTALLTCQSNRFIDNSANNFTITRNGDVRVTKEAPFLPTAAYSTSLIGGSGYFDGNGDYLSINDALPCTFGSGDFTIEFWLYLSSTQTAILYDGRPVGGVGATPTIYLSSNVLYYFTNNANRITGSTLSNTTWTHVALCKSGGSTRLFVNGTQVGSTYADSVTYTNTAGRPLIGASGETVGQFPLSGYMSDVRVVKGTALYTSTFTPPTAPLTAPINTSLLLSFTNAGIFDNAAENDLETVGNAQISTSVKKYGTGSIAFDGNGDYLVVPAGQNLTFGSGDFTIEFWVYEAASQTANLYDQRSTGIQVTPVIYLNSNALTYYVNGNQQITGASLPTGQWNHVAVSRSGTSTKMFLNGTQTGSTYTDTNVYVSAPIGIGAYPVSGVSPFSGYIDDLRITKGVARYTANFTPPTAAFPDQ